MARQEHPREDLLTEATALVWRVELSVPEWNESITVGFRAGGDASFYFGPDVVYQFNGDRRLRRAFVDDLLYKAEQGRLVSLRRQRVDNQVQLVGHRLRPEEQRDFLARMNRQLGELRDALNADNFQIIGQVPDGEDIVPRVADWLSASADSIDVAKTARVG